jgi:predicted  nucleic acid-binding Zn ribbon protein
MLCEYLFAPRADGDKARDELGDWVHAFVSRCQKSGLLWGPVLSDWVDGVLRVVCQSPHADSLAFEHRDRHVNSAYEKVVALCSAQPTWRVQGDSDGQQASSLPLVEAPGLFIYTDMFDETSPVRHGSDGAPIPLYKVPVDWKLREQLYEWMRAYRLYDEIWLRSGPLEGVIYKELSQPESAMAQEGRELARRLEEATELPTYYFLKHYWERRKEDVQSRCPSCAGDWAETKLGTEQYGLDWFEYRCDHCRLISEVASAVVR